MALTKVRPPVTDISQLSNSATIINIPTPSADIDVDVSGVDVLDLGSSSIVAGVPLSVTNVDDVENIDLTVSGGATGVIEAIVASLRLWTTSAHSLVLGANSTAGLTIETDGQVTLGVEGTDASHLVTKSYVDGKVAGALDGIVATIATSGSVTIPTSGGDLIINWGETGSLANDASAAVTFSTAFPNSFLVGFATAHHGLGGDGGINISAESTTGMTVYNVSDTTTTAFWLAIGF